MNYVGVDLHKERSWFYVMNEQGKKISSKSISNELGVLKEYFQSIPKPFTLAGDPFLFSSFLLFSALNNTYSFSCYLFFSTTLQISLNPHRFSINYILTSPHYSFFNV